MTPMKGVTTSPVDPIVTLGALVAERPAGIAELCIHIVAVHHEGLRDAMPRIEALLSTVARVHGEDQPDLRELQRAFTRMRAELEAHLAAEETGLFPACLVRERNGTAIAESLLEQHEREQAVVGHALAALRVLGREHALCNTHRALLHALEAFELDFHQHILEENNVLIPRMRELNAQLSATPAPPNAARTPGRARELDPLPPCCQAWIAEQNHAWHLRRR